MKNKKGWLRIFEATIAVLLVSGVLVVNYSNKPDRSLDASEYVYNIQKAILDEISLNETLRALALNSTNETVSETLNHFVELKTPNSFNSRLRICDLEEKPNPCKLNLTDFAMTQDGDVFVMDTVLSSNLTDYSPKKLRLFVWEERV